MEYLNVRIKICGITNVKDAKVASSAGADAIGLVFFEKSSRNVSIQQAVDIVKSLPAFVTSTALFVNPTVAFVEQVIKKTKIDLLQFHGDESEIFCNQFSRPYIKAIRISDETCLETVANQYKSAQSILFDTFVKGVAGGTGQTFNWQLLNQQAKQNIPNVSIILAGGLNENNVTQAINITRPWAVDVSGGVEIEAGLKSSSKINNFIKAVNK